MKKLVRAFFLTLAAAGLVLSANCALAGDGSCSGGNCSDSCIGPGC